MSFNNSLANGACVCIKKLDKAAVKAKEQCFYHYEKVKRLNTYDAERLGKHMYWIKEGRTSCLLDEPEFNDHFIIATTKDELPASPDNRSSVPDTTVNRQEQAHVV